MAKFDKVARTKDKNMVRFQELDGKTGVWATCTPAVKGYASTTFKAGDIVDVQSEPTGEVGLHVTRISKAGQGGGVTTSTVSTTAPTCEDCGKALKDAKYKKCYTCNKKNPSKSGGSYGKTPEVQESIKRQAIGHMVSRTLIALTGQIDRNSVTEVMEVLYKHYQELVG